MEMKDRPRPWSVNIPAAYSQTGKRERKFFNTKREALDYAKDEKIRVEREGRDATATLSVSQRDAAAAAFRLLEGHPPQKMIEIVEQWLSKRKLASQSVTVTKAFEEYLTRGKKKRGRGGMAVFAPFSVKHKRGIKYAQEALEAHQGKMVCNLAAKDISDALAGCSPSYHNAHLRIIRAVCEYSVERKWSVENAAEDVAMKAGTVAAQAAKPTAAETPILTIEEVKRLFEVADAAAPQLVPFFALALFGGIRPDLEDGELIKLTWDMVRLKDKELVIPSSISKTRKRRLIEMEDNLVQWLEYYVAKRCKAEGIKEVGGVIVPKTNLRARMRLVRDLAGVEWEQDITRHSFASYHLPHFKNLLRIIDAMGHRDSSMIEQHYRASVPKDVAAKYWQITPDALGLA
jgi:integrase